jgi:signal transduction histidine kinase
MNAFQAMNGSGTLTVETRPSSRIDTGHDGTVLFGDQSAPSTSMVDVAISDTGQGIPQKLLPRIFDPFFSTKDTGAGLGLSMVHKIVDNHRGRIRVDSAAGSGTTFTVSLPCANQVESEG